MRLKIIPNPKKPWAVELAREVSAFLALEYKTVRKGAEATICIGGDGTILYAHYKNRIEGPILGIGAEKSYICQLDRYSWKEKIKSILASEVRERIMTLTCTIGNKNYSAINDVVVHATHYRVAEMNVATGSRSTSFEGDGIIVSSSIGSTGYAFSAGGPKARPTERNLIVVPICPYRRAFSPCVLSEDETTEVTVGSDCALIIDGVFVRRLKKSEKVTVQKGSDILFFSGVGRWE